MINEGHIYKNKRSKRRLKWSVQMSCKYSRFRVSFKREICPPRVETAADKKEGKGKVRSCDPLYRSREKKIRGASSLYK